MTLTFVKFNPRLLDDPVISKLTYDDTFAKLWISPYEPGLEYAMWDRMLELGLSEEQAKLVLKIILRIDFKNESNSIRTP